MEDLRTNLKTEFQDEDYRYAYGESFLNTKIATQIKVLREQREKTQAELGAMIGTKQSGFSRFEDVNHSVWRTDTLWKIARALGVRVNISFDTFGNLIDEKEHFDREYLKRPAFQEDPAFAADKEQDAAATTDGKAGAVVRTQPFPPQTFIPLGLFQEFEKNSKALTELTQRVAKDTRHSFGDVPKMMSELVSQWASSLDKIRSPLVDLLESLAQQNRALGESMRPMREWAEFSRWSSDLVAMMPESLSPKLIASLASEAPSGAESLTPEMAVNLHANVIAIDRPTHRKPSSRKTTLRRGRRRKSQTRMAAIA